MNKPLLLTGFLCLILAGSAPAQVGVDDFNRVGVFAEYDMFWDNCLTVRTNQVYLVSLYLWNPMNESFGGTEFRPVQSVAGFECRLTATGAATILARHYPVPAIDVGTYGSMIVGFGEPVPVHPDHPTKLADVDVLFLEPEEPAASAADPAAASPVGCQGGTGFLWLAPAAPASLDGMLAFLDADDPDGDPLVGARVVDLYEGAPVLTIVPTPTAVAPMAWDGVKALYR